MATHNAICDDIVTYFDDHEMRTSVASDALRVNDVVGLLMYLIDDDAGDAAARARMHRLVKSAQSGSGGPVSLACVLRLVSKVCGTAFADADANQIRALFAPAAAQIVVQPPMPLAAPDVDAIVPAAPSSYAASSAEELRAMLVQRDLELKHWKDKCESYRRSSAYYRRKAADLRDALANVTTEHKQLVAQTNFRPGKRRVSLYGGYSLALRRNYGHCGAETVVAMIAGDAAHGWLKSKSVVMNF